MIYCSAQFLYLEVSTSEASFKQNSAQIVVFWVVTLCSLVGGY
jgi:hypothetical protein